MLLDTPAPRHPQRPPDAPPPRHRASAPPAPSCRCRPRPPRRRSAPRRARFPNKSVYDIALAGNTIYLYGDSAFFSIDISVPSNPKKISELTIPAPDDNGTYLEYKKLTVLNHYAFTTFRDSSVTIFNISDPSKMNILGKIKTVARPVKVGVTQSEDSLIIYIAEVDSGLQIYAWVNNSFSMVNKIKENLPIVGLKIRDKNLFLASDAGLNIYDISKNKNPYLISRILVSAGSFPDISISGDYTYMEGDGHLVIINIKDLLNPKEVEDIMYPSRVVTAFGNIVFLGISLNGILILENKLVTSTNDLLTNVLKSTFKLYQNYPNPFNPCYYHRVFNATRNIENNSFSTY